MSGALTRSDGHAAAFDSQGIRPVIGDVLNPASLKTLPSADTVLWAVGYDRTQSFSKREVYVDGLRNVLDAIPSAAGRLILTSSTSVLRTISGGMGRRAVPMRAAQRWGPHLPESRTGRPRSVLWSGWCLHPEAVGPVWSRTVGCTCWCFEVTATGQRPPERMGQSHSCRGCPGCSAGVCRPSSFFPDSARL